MLPFISSWRCTFLLWVNCHHSLPVTENTLFIFLRFFWHMRSRLFQVGKKTAQFCPVTDLAMQTNKCKASSYSESLPCQVSLPGSSFSWEKCLFLAGVCLLHQLFVILPGWASSSTHCPLILILVSCLCVSLFFSQSVAVCK